MSKRPKLASVQALPKPAKKKESIKSAGARRKAKAEATNNGLPGARNASEIRMFPQPSPLSGSRFEEFDLILVREVEAAIGAVAQSNLTGLACAALAAFKPEDEIEGMIAAQVIALHYGAMQCLRNAAASAQPDDIAARYRKDAANLARAMTDMLDALDRKRGKAQQVVRVEKVIIEDGGQAIVGAISSNEVRRGRG